MIRIAAEKPPTYPLLANGEHVYLVARNGRRVVFSVLTGVDRRFIRLTGIRQGWFFCPETCDNPQIIHAVLAEAISFQRALGMERLVGPRAPDGRFYPGLLIQGPNAASGMDAALQSIGFCAFREYVSFLVGKSARQQIEQAADRAMERHRYETRRARYSKASCQSVYALYEGTHLTFEDFSRQLAGLGRFQLYFVGREGRDAGFLLARRDRRLERVETLMIAPENRRGGAFLSLAAAASRGLGRNLATGAIDRQNGPSMALARAFCGEPYEVWREYQFDLINNLH